MTTETETAFAELLAEVGATQARMVEQLADDEATLLEAHKWVLSILQVAAEVTVWADTARPRFVEIVGPYKKWGGDNADAFYCYAPIDPSRTYRVQRPARRRRLPVPHRLRRSRRRPLLHPHRRHRQQPEARRRAPTGPSTSCSRRTIRPSPASAWIRLEPDAVAAITRDYLDDPRTGPAGHLAASRRTTRPRPSGRTTPTWPGASGPWRPGCASRPASCPSRSGAPNAIDPPYPVPTTTFGWAAGDAAYAMGAFELDDDEALVIRGRSPECVFWNMCLWNRLLHTYNYDYERVTINGAQVRYEPDGSWIIVVSARRPAHPNWVSTAGHRTGRIWFRWFLPADTPEQPQVEVLPVATRMSARPAAGPHRRPGRAPLQRRGPGRSSTSWTRPAHSCLLEPGALMDGRRGGDRPRRLRSRRLRRATRACCAGPCGSEGGFNGAGRHAAAHVPPGAAARTGCSSRTWSDGTPRSSTSGSPPRSSSAGCPGPAPPTCTTSCPPTRRSGRSPTGRASSRSSPSVSGQRPARPTPPRARPRLALSFLDAALPYFNRMHEMTVEHVARGDPAARHRLLDHALRDDGADARCGATTTWPATSDPATPTCARSSRCCSGCGAGPAGCSSPPSTSSSSPPSSRRSPTPPSSSPTATRCRSPRRW